MRGAVPLTLLTYSLCLIAGAATGVYLQPLVPKEYPLDIGSSTENSEFVKLSNQFVVPLFQQQRVSALVVLSLSFELHSGQSDLIFRLEPKLRDALLQVLFDHAQSGGFEGSFTDAAVLQPLRQALKDRASQIAGPAVIDVLITELGRQDR